MQVKQLIKYLSQYNQEKEVIVEVFDDKPPKRIFRTFCQPGFHDSLDCIAIYVDGETRPKE